MAAFGVLLSALIVVLFLVDLRARYHGAIDQAKSDALDHAQILADNTAVTFETVDRVLRETELIRRGASSGSDATPEAANAALRHLDQTSPIVVAIGWTNARAMCWHVPTTRPRFRQTSPTCRTSSLSAMALKPDCLLRGLFVRLMTISGSSRHRGESTTLTVIFPAS